MSGHPNAELLRRGLDAFGARDLATLRTLFAVDAHWTIPGRNALAGRYDGLDAILGMLGRVVELTGGTYSTTPTFVLADDEHVVAAYRAAGSRDGRTLDIEQLLLCRIENGQIREVVAVPTEQDAFDAFWA